MPINTMRELGLSTRPPPAPIEAKPEMERTPVAYRAPVSRAAAIRARIIAEAFSDAA